jgi:signal transduction histidine kinase
MSAAPGRAVRWRRRFGLEPLDCWLAALRAAALVTGIAWWALAPDWTRAPQLPILGTFALFTVAFYLLNALRPGRIATLYRVALVFDLGIVFLLLRITGGFASDLHLAFILLIALHAFYFGLTTGLATAAAAIGLYALAGEWPPPMPGFVLRVGAFALVGLCMGVVSEQARRQREALEQQHEQLIRSERLATIGELAAGLAHELRNPLAGIGGVLRVLAGRLSPEDATRALLADVQAQTARMEKTLSELLQHARPAAPTLVDVDVNGLLEQSLRVLPRGAIEIVRQFDESIPPLRADPGLLHQAFLNVLVNARQAMAQGGRLTLRTELSAAGCTVRVLISDTGIGIAPEHLGRVFQAFFTTKSRGTGLGLAIAARAVEQHGGRITVASEPGRGSTFTIALPVDAPIGCTRREAHAAPGAGR